MRFVRYSENYVVADYVIARKFSTQLMLFPQGLSHFVRYSEIYVIAGVVIARSDLYAPTVELECAQASLGDPKSQKPPPAPRAGLGTCPPRHFSKPPRKELLDTFQVIEAEAQISKLKSLQIQGKWLEWSSVMWHDTSWTSLLYGGTGRDLKFILASTQDVLPSPANLRRWGNTEVDPLCALCRRPSTLRHVLCSCTTALMEGQVHLAS